MTTEQQRKMMECAAKACEYEILDWYGERYTAHDGEKLIAFNPLTNPADCFSMCAKLKIDTTWEDVSVFCSVPMFLNATWFEDHNNDRETAWRYAATMVAAKIGGMK